MKDSPTTEKRTGEATAKARGAILEALADMPWTLTKTELRKSVGGGHETFTKALDKLVTEGTVSHNMVRRTEAGIEKKRPLWGLRETRPDDNRTGCDSEDL